MTFKTHKVIFILLSLPLVMACHRQEKAEKADVKLIQMPEMSEDIQLPTQLWDLVTGASFEKAVKQSVNFIFVPISVRLEQKTPGIFSEGSMKFVFPKGGGEIDFAKYVQSDRGTFRIFFDFDGFANAESLQIFYVSRSRKRKIDDEIFGSGCKQFFDVKDYVSKANAQEGLLVNVTRDRHDSAVGGNFLFSYKKDKQTYVSQVTFTDSKRPDLFCEVIKK